MKQKFSLAAVRTQHAQMKKQRGVTLMELIASLSVMAVVVVGAVSLFGSATASERANAMQRDLSALQSATRSLYAGQGSYGTDSINSVLNSSKKIPSTLNVSGTGATLQINHRDNGEFQVKGATDTFTIDITKIKKEICIPLVTNASGWKSVKVGSGTEITSFPISPATAETNCSADEQTITFTD